MPSVMRHTPIQPNPTQLRCYPLKAKVAYRLMEGDGVRHLGRIQTISANRVSFEAESGLPGRALIELEVDWPVRLDNRTPLKLVISGRTIQIDNNFATVEILRHEFRTRSLASAADSAVHVTGSTRRTRRPCFR